MDERTYNEGHHIRGRHHEIPRPELTRVIEVLENGGSVHLTGGRKLGKTLVLTTLEERLPNAIVAVHSLQNSGNRTHSALFVPLAKTLQRAIAKRLERLGCSPAPPVPNVTNLNPYNDFLEWVTQCSEHIGASYGHLPIVIALDEGEHLLRVAEPSILLGNLRALCEDGNIVPPIQLVLAGFHALHVFRDPNDGLSPLRNLCKSVSLGPLPSSSAHVLYTPLLAHVDPVRSEEITSWLDKETGGHPFLIQALCSRLSRVLSQDPRAQLDLATQNLDRDFEMSAFVSLCDAWNLEHHETFVKVARTVDCGLPVSKTEIHEYCGVMTRSGATVNAFCGRFNRWYFGRHSQTPAPSHRKAIRGGRLREPNILAVATEWQSGHGGLSTLNRQLCCALAAGGANVCCIVLAMGDGDRLSALERGVILVKVPSTSGMSSEVALARRPLLPDGFIPDVIIGHGRVTGPASKVIQEDHFPAAKRLHFVHMAPDEIEWHKTEREDDTGTRAEERTLIELDLGKTATRVVAIGPRLYQRYLNDLHPYATSLPIRLDPGFDSESDTPRTPPPGRPVKVLVLGRMEDHRLKGLDLAARAVGLAVEWRAPTSAAIELVVRGAASGTTSAVRDAVREWAGVPSLSVVVRPYTHDIERLEADILRASLILMPSRSEGFGLVGLEAIVAGTPVLVSSDSGLGALLQEALDSEQAHRFVVQMSGDDERDRTAWGRAIDAILRDCDGAFRRTEEVRSLLMKTKSWDAAVRNLYKELGYLE